MLNIQYYKVEIKSKVEQSKEMSQAFSLKFGVIANEKGTYRLPSATITNFTLLFVILEMKLIYLVYINITSHCHRK